MISCCQAAGFHRQGELTMTKNNTILDIPGMDIQQLQEQIGVYSAIGKQISEKFSKKA